MKNLSIVFVCLLCGSLMGAIPPPIQSTQLTTNIAKASPSNSVFRVTNSASGMGEWVLLPSSGGGGGASNAVSTIQSNGVDVATGVTNLNFSSGTNISFKLTNSPSGLVSVAAHLNPAVTTGASNYTDVRLGSYVENSGGNATNLAIRTPNGGPGTVALTVNTNRLVVENGLVGVGTNHPQARLHVVGDGSSSNLIRAGLTTVDPIFWVDTNSQIAASNGFRISTNTSFQDQEWVTEKRLQTVVLGLKQTVYFLRTNAHPVVAGTLATRLDREPTDQFLTNVLSAGSNQVAIWLSTNFVASGVVPAGNYSFHIHARKTAAGPDVTIGVDLVRTNGSGIVTLASGETNAIPSTTEDDFDLNMSLSAAVVVSPTDYIGVRYYAIRGGGGVNVITHVGGGSDCHFSTPSLGGGVGATTINVQTNGVSANATASTVNFVGGTNTLVTATNQGSGVVSVAVHALGGGGTSFTQSALVSTNPLTIDMAGTIFQTVTLTNDVLFLATNIAQAKVVWVNVSAGVTNRNLTFGTNWTFESALRPGVLASNTGSILELRSWGSINSNVTARWNPLNYAGNWSPSNLTVMPAFWYQADRLAGASNSAVSAWANSGLFTNELSQGTAGLQPVLYTGFLNGHSVVLFAPTNASVKRLTVSGTGSANYLANQLYVFALLNPIAYSNYTAGNGYASQIIFGCNHSGGTFDAVFGVGAVAGVPRFVQFTEDAAINASPYSFNIEATNLISGSPWIIVEWAADSMSSFVKYFYNGSSFGSGYSPGSGKMNMVDSFVGHEASFGLGYNGFMAELMVFPSLVVQSDRERIEGYLAWKYGIQTNLPPDHVFRNSAP